MMAQKPDGSEVDSDEQELLFVAERTDGDVNIEAKDTKRGTGGGTVVQETGGPIGEEWDVTV
jgi:hypothetical protein